MHHLKLRASKALKRPLYISLAPICCCLSALGPSPRAPLINNGPLDFKERVTAPHREEVADPVKRSQVNLSPLELGRGAKTSASSRHSLSNRSSTDYETFLNDPLVSQRDNQGSQGRWITVSVCCADCLGGDGHTPSRAVLTTAFLLKAQPETAH